MSEVLQHHILRAGPIGAIDIKENGIMFTLKYSTCRSIVSK